MNLEDAKMFLERKGYIGANESEKARLIVEAVKAREKQIADGLEALLGTAYEERQARLARIVDRLRSGGGE